MLFLPFAVIIILLLILFKKWRNRHFSDKISQFNGPTVLEIVKFFVTKRGSPPECFRQTQEWMKRYESCFTINTLMNTYVCTGRREDVQISYIQRMNHIIQMLSKMNQKGHVYRFFHSTMGAGLLCSNGVKWKTHKAIMESAFSAKRLSTSFLHIFNEQSRLLIEEIERKGLEEEFSLWPLILRTVTRTIVQTTIGSLESDDLHLPQKYGSGNRRAEQLMMKRVYSPWLYPDIMFKLYLLWTKESRLFEAIRKPFLTAIKKRKLLSSEKRISTAEMSHSRTLILDILMKNDLTDEELTDEIMTLMFASTDTTATAICHTLLMLAMNPHIQEKVHEELNAVFPGNRNKPAEASDLPKLRFLNQCIKESLRTLSIVPFVERYVTTDTALSDGRVVPAGANFLLFIHEIHNNPEYYPNPEVWNPHNFDEENVAKRPLNTFIPFALGARQCVGSKFAMRSMTVSLSTILRNFKLTTDQTEVKLDYNLIVRCRSGYRVKFERRQKEEYETPY